MNYIADAHGFRASIQSNEPGVAPKDSAGVTYNKPLVAQVVAAPAYAAPAYPAALAYDPIDYAQAEYPSSYVDPLALNPAFAPYYAHGLALPYGNFGVRRR